MTKTDEVVIAKRLYVERFMTGSAVAEELNISLTNFYRWAKKYGWKEKRDERLRLIKDLGFSLEDFEKFVQINHPESIKHLKSLIRKFRNSKKP